MRCEKSEPVPNQVARSPAVSTSARKSSVAFAVEHSGATSHEMWAILRAFSPKRGKDYGAGRSRVLGPPDGSCGPFWASRRLLRRGGAGDARLRRFRHDAMQEQLSGPHGREADQARLDDLHANPVRVNGHADVGGRRRAQGGLEGVGAFLNALRVDRPF